MRISPAVFGTAALAITLGLAVSTGAAPKHMAKHSTKMASSSGLVAKGKALISSKRCNGCHGANLEGKKNFSPDLHASKRPMSHYTEATFVRLLTKGLDDDGKPVRPPMTMACHQTPTDAKAMYAYLKTVK